jgi:hypothetical protein
MRRTLMLVGCLCVLLSVVPQMASAKAGKTKTLLHKDGKVVYSGEVVEGVIATVAGSNLSCTTTTGTLFVGGNTKETLLENVLPGCPEIAEPRLVQITVKKVGKKLSAFTPACRKSSCLAPAATTI